MIQRPNRRNFIRMTAASALVAQSIKPGLAKSDQNRTVRLGMIGMGGRGCSLLRILVTFPNVKIPAICDIKPKRIDYALRLIQDAGLQKPEIYQEDEYAYEDLVSRDDIDAIIIATPWNWHAKMAVSAMNAGKYAGVEVPAAITIDECWDLVKTSERTGIPCMMLENWSFRRDNLAVLNMIRQGIIGETVHSQCSYSHDCVTYFFEKDGSPRWQGEFLLNHNRDQYPTHGLGPVLSWLNINCGDRFDTLVSVATAPFGVSEYFKKLRQKDENIHTPAVTQGDIVSTIIKTVKGKTIYITNDMMLPRPYDNRWLLQGTCGIYSHEHNSIYIENQSPKSHTWEPFESYQTKFEHRLWKNAPTNIEQLGHGGPDYLELAEFVNAVRNRIQTPLDVYDSVTMSSVVALSGQSITQNSFPVKCPDFTSGAWESTAPKFAL